LERNKERYFMILFDGNTSAIRKEVELAQQVAELKKVGRFLTIGAILFQEDAGSQLYTRLKHEAATRIGIEYRAYPFSMKTDVELIFPQLEKLNEDVAVTGIIVQKPLRSKWMEVTSKTAEEFQIWWSTLVSHMTIEKDVDGLHPDTLEAVRLGTWREEGKVLPATVQAVLEILKQARKTVDLDLESKYIILGKSDILGKPLFYELQNQGKQVEMIGTKELKERADSGRMLFDADVIISATGYPSLITGELISEGAVVIDVGEPRPDADFATISQKAAFITPVPGGVGPMTVICLMENAVKLEIVL